MPQVDLERMRAVFREAPFVADLGIEPEAIESDGTLVTSLAVQPRMNQVNGFVHAGVQSTLADHSMGAAAFLAAPAGFHVLTAELKVSLLRAAKCERLQCRARVIKPGRQLSFTEAEVWALGGAKPQLVCKASATMAMLPAD